MCLWFHEKSRAICPGVKWLDPAQPQVIFWLEISSCSKGETLWGLGYTVALMWMSLWLKMASATVLASVSSSARWVGVERMTSQSPSSSNILILCRTVSIVCGAQCKMKMPGAKWEFEDGSSGTLNQAPDPPTHGVHMPSQVVCP